MLLNQFYLLRHRFSQVFTDLLQDHHFLCVILLNQNYISEIRVYLPATLPARARPLAKHREADGRWVAYESSA